MASASAGAGWAAIVVPPEAPPQINEIEPEEQTIAFGRPLEVGEPIDMAHWARLRYPGLPPEEALERARDETSEPATESVVIQDPRERPALYAARADIHSTERVPPKWFDPLQARRTHVSQIARSVGRLEVYGLQTAGARFFLGFTAGTAFVVAPEVLMTNRHVTALFADGAKLKRNRETNEAAEVWINFRATLAEDGGGESRFRVTEVIYSGGEHDHDISLLRFADPESTGPPPVPLQIQPPEHEVRLRQVFVAGYPFDNVNFFRSPAVKRIAPGVLKQIFRGVPEHPVLYHDCSTARGNSGSPVVDLETGRVYGVHFAGQTDNHAEVMWEVLRVAEIRDALGLSGVDPRAEVLSAEIVVPRPALLVDRNRRPVLSRLEFGGRSMDARRPGQWTAAVGQIQVARRREPVLGGEGLEPADWMPLGTGFLVAPGVVMTAGFVAEQTLGSETAITFDLTFDADPSAAARFTLGEPILLGEGSGGKPLLGLFRVDPVPDLEPLPLDLTTEPSPGQPITVVGFHYHDARMPSNVFNAVFEGPEGVKRISPGLTVVSPSVRGSLGGPWAFAHDATTAGGSGGAPILDLSTGAVVGLHLGGLFETTNWGLSLARLVQQRPDLGEKLAELLGG